MRRRRYVSWVSETHVNEERPTCDVYEADLEPIDTGILDENGIPIYRFDEREPIGFFIRDLEE